MASLIDFIDRDRVLLDQPPLGAVVVLGTVPDDDDRSLLSKALGCTVVAVDSTTDIALDCTFAKRLAARRVGIVMGLAWHPTPPIIALPTPVEDLIVSEHRGFVEADDVGFLRGWWIPDDDDERTWSYLMPTDTNFLPDGSWQAPYSSRAGSMTCRLTVPSPRGASR